MKLVKKIKAVLAAAAGLALIVIACSGAFEGITSVALLLGAGVGIMGAAVIKLLWMQKNVS